MKKIKILIYKLWNKVYCWCHKKPKVVGTDDTLDKLIVIIVQLVGLEMENFLLY